ncbi:MAG: GTP-binding protein [Candidatus Hodarchaeaceae archaeon]|nr:GTP-binding protein [Candidatus Hodarchaeaceae archaeon]
MPANLPPEYFKAEERYLQAKTVEEKILATQELIRIAPKHKGTEKLLKVLKRRLAKLRLELRKQQTRRVGGGPSFHVKKEGAAQVALVGMPNSGKSMLLRRLTSAQPEVAEYPFTTREPVPGMMEFEDVQIQLVEVPALIEGSNRGRGLGAQPLSVARNADAIALIVDASSDPLEQMEILLAELEKAGIKLNQRPPKLSIQRQATGGIEVRGIRMFKGERSELKRILQEQRIHNAVVIIEEPITAEELEDVLDESSVYRRAITIANKGDMAGEGDGFEKLQQAYGGRFPTILVSAANGDNLAKLKELIFESLNVVRVYTKRPDEEPARRPLVLPKSSTVLDAAEAIHKEFARDLKFARVWGSTRFAGQQVPRDYVLRDKDIVEIHI